MRGARRSLLLFKMFHNHTLVFHRALLSVATKEGRDVETLKNAALQVMALDYRTLTMLNLALQRR